MISLKYLIMKNDAAMKILNSLSKGASFEIGVENGERLFLVREKSGIAFFSSQNGINPDFSITMSEDLVLKLFSEEASLLNFEDYLVFSAKLLAAEGKNNVQLTIYANFLKLTFHGYPKLIPLGGTSFLKVLKDNGVGSLFAIEKKLATFKNK